MAQLLCREESTSTMNYFQSIKKCHDSSKFVYEDAQYIIEGHPSHIKQITKVGEKMVAVASCKEWGYPQEGLFSNGVVWRGEAFFFNYGLLWAINLTDFSWRKIPQLHPEGPMWEYSDRRDLLLLTNESKGDFLFARFRPSSDDSCEYIITYSMRVHSSSDAVDVTVLESNARSSDGIIIVPSWITRGTMDDELRLERGLEDEDRKVPRVIAERLQDIGEGILPYPRSQEGAEKIWRPTSTEEEKEQIENLRKRKFSSSFSRSCSICFSPNPSARAAFTSCANDFMCQFCQKKTSFVRIFEEEESKKNEIEIIVEPGMKE